LRALVEERLMQSEDYRALKALDKAIAESRGPQPKVVMKPSPEESPVAAQQGQLQQRLVDKYTNASV
jgi:hypothetical protein